MKDKIFYYHFNWLNGWFVLNAVLIIMFAYCAIACPCVLMFSQTPILLGVLFFSIGFWVYKYICRHQAVLITDSGIKIDHTQMLRWKDVAAAEKCDILCCFKKRRIISLVPKDGIDYHYNYLQKHNCFPPFSVPLYCILTPEDEAELEKMIASKVKIKDKTKVKK